MQTYTLAVVAAVCFVLAGCSSKGPQDQQDFMKIVDKMQEDYSAAEKKHNHMLEQEVVDEYKGKLFDSSQSRENWVADVKEVSGTFGVMIFAKHGDVKLNMLMRTREAQDFAHRLKRGDEIVFSGSLGHEGSFTGYGMVSAPEFAFTPTSIAKKGDSEVIKQ